jgi:hypothetical protein
MNKEQLIEIIDKAFDGVVAPTEVTLHIAEAYDDYDYEHDVEHRKKDYVGKWQDIPSEHIASCQSALSFVGKIGMRYYLPAYLVWYLNNFGDSEEIWTDHTLYSLDNYSSDEMLSNYHKERFSLFNAQQLSACALFVKYCADDKSGFTDIDFARKKYDRYWKQFEITK